MMGPFRMGVFWRRAFAALVLGRKARVDCFRTVADLLESGFELERALDVTVRAQRGQGPSLRAGLLEGWRRALIENRFAEAMAASAPPAEAMIFQPTGVSRPPSCSPPRRGSRICATGRSRRSARRWPCR